MKKMLLRSVPLVILLLAVSAVVTSAEETYDVPLAAREPVFSRVDIPGGFDPGFGYYPFRNIEWLRGGFFVVGGNAASAVRSATGGGGQFERGGMYVLREDGSFVGSRDVVFDTSVRAAACFEGGGCTAGTQVLPVGPNSFIRELEPGSGFRRAPVLYGTTPTGINLAGRLFFNDRVEVVGEVIEYDHIAYANGSMIGVEIVYKGRSAVVAPGFAGSGSIRDRYAESNAIYSIPGMGKLTEFSGPQPTCPSRNCSGVPPLTVPHYYPVIGVGDYFIATERAEHRAPFRIYRMPGQAELGGGGLPQLVQTLEADGILGGYALDAQNPLRIALFTQDGTEKTLGIYEAGSSGLSLVSEEGAPNFDVLEPGEQHQFALVGEHLVYSKCTSGRISGLGGSHSDCDLVVEQDGEKLSVEPLPKSDPNARQRIVSLAVSASGRILVATDEVSAEVDGTTGEKDRLTDQNGRLYLYQIDGVTLPPGGDGFPPTGGGAVPSSNIPGQLLEITYPAGKTNPDILIRFAILNSVAQGNMSLSIYGQTYAVNTQNAQFLRFDRTPAALSEFIPGSYVNIFGALDIETGTSVNASIVRNPLPVVGQGSAGPTPAAAVVPVTAPAATPANTAAQSTLNSLQQILLQLQQRLQ